MHKACSKILMQKDNKSEAECLFTLCVIPVTHLIKVDTFVHWVENCSEKTTHESQIMFVHRFERWNKLNIIWVNIGSVLFIHKFRCLFLHCQVNYPLELFPPDLLSLDIQEILDILNRALETDKITLDFLKFVSKFTKSSFTTLDLGTLLISLDLSFIIDTLTHWFDKNELFVQYLCKFAAELIS